MQHTPRRISQPNLRLPTALLLEELTHTRQCPTRPRSACETVQGSPSLLPDLRTGGFVVRPGVCDVIELVRPHRVGEFLREFLRLVVVVPRVFVRYRWDRVDFGTEHFQEIDLFLTLNKTENVKNLSSIVAKFSYLGVRHENNTSIPLGSTHMRKADPSISCRSLHYRTPWF